MRFHFVALIMLAVCGYLLHLLLVGFRDDLKAAKVTIQKEGVRAVTVEKVWKNKDDELKPFINKNLLDKPQHSRMMADVERAASDGPNVDPLTEPREMALEGKNYWCKSVPLILEKNPVKCLYPSACFGCDGPIIRPEIESAAPLCENGVAAQLFNVECCPKFARGLVDCPPPEQCFHDDTVPQDFCSCNGRADCKLIDVAGTVQCMCSNF